MLTLAIANQKGGVGKTTTTINLGYGMGGRVLLIDCDPQGSLTQALGVNPELGNLADVISGKLQMSDIIQHKGRIDIAPASLELAGCELGMVARLGREYLLRKALSGLDYELVILDCGPSLGLLVINALVAAQGVLIPTVPDAFGLRGLALFQDSLDTIRTELNPGLQLLGVVVTQYDKRSTLHQAALDELKASGVPMLGVIKRSVKIARSAGQGLPQASGDLAAQYLQVTKGIQSWLKMKN